MSRLARSSVVLILSLAGLVSCHAGDDAAVHGDAHATAASSPPLPVTTRSPSARPESGDPYALEKSLGAQCPGDGHSEPTDVIDSPCQGLLPPPLRSLLLHLPETGFDWPLADRRRLAAKTWSYRAVPGLGQQPDFFAGSSNLWLRSFEGPDPATTVFLVHGGYTCHSQAPRCAHPMEGLLAFRVSGDGPIEDVTNTVLPHGPEPTPQETRRYAQYGGSELVLNSTKLQYAPALRWFMEFDPEAPIPLSDPRNFGPDWALAHFGFLVWTGTRFEMRKRVPRHLWPCAPSSDGFCAGYGESRNDRFIFADKNDDQRN